MPKANRLQLNFKLETDEERTGFLTSYLTQEQFQNYPPTEDELETMGNYLLWGKNPESGLNVKQTGLVELESRHHTWDVQSHMESLDGLMEAPTFNEATLRPLTANPYRVKKEAFSRSQTLAQCPEDMRLHFQELFKRIDKLELGINFYDLEHGKRKNPPRDELLSRLSAEEQEECRDMASHWNQYKYLKIRHLLVELRREQYTLRDTFMQSMFIEGSNLVMPVEGVEFELNVPALPLGLDQEAIGGLVFRKWENIYPQQYSEETKQIISKLYWDKQEFFKKCSDKTRYLDFRNEEHIYQLLSIYWDLKDAAERAEYDSNLPALVRTLDFYIERAELTEVQQEILDLKLSKIKNVDIADKVNEHWYKSYTPNYISTIFRQKIIPRIAAAAKYHEKLISNIGFEEEFKTCTCCGRTLLRDVENFTHKKRATDGFTARCKICEKKARNGDK